MKILDSTKTLTQLSTDTTNGLGNIHPLTCVVNEVLNGEYEAELTVSANEKYFSLLNIGTLLEIELDAVRGKQIFEVYYVSKPMNEIVSVRCQHITYRLNKIPVSTFSSTGAVYTVNSLLSHVIGSNDFTMTTDITNTTSEFELTIPRYFRECLGGYEGSILDVFRGEYEWDNLTVKMLAHRGSDEGVRIAYGKNLTDFSQEENNQNVFTSVLGYAIVDGVTYTGNVYDKVVATNKKVKIVDFSSDYTSGQVPTVSELTDKAQAYATNNDIESPQVSISISFVPLYETEEYKNIAPLERVNLGDTVHVYFDKLGVEATSRVIKTTWNVLKKRYDSVELGDLRANLNSVLEEQSEQTKKEIINSLDNDTGFIESELNQLGSLIINGLGLFKTVETLGDNSSRIYLHNKPALADSDIQYYISANGLVVSTDYGATWNAGFNPDGSAVLNALSANIIKALQIYGSYIQGSQIVFGDLTDKYVIAQPYYDGNNDPLGVQFSGTGNVVIMPTGMFQVKASDGTDDYVMTLDDTGYNLESDGNYIKMSSSGKITIGNSSASLEIDGTGNSTDVMMKNGTNSFVRIYHSGGAQKGIHIKSDTIELTDSSSYQTNNKHISISSTNGVEVQQGLYSKLAITNNGATLKYNNIGITINSSSMTLDHVKDITYVASTGFNITDTSNNKMIVLGSNTLETKALTQYIGSNTSTNIYIGASSTNVYIKGHRLAFSNGQVLYT